MRTRREVIGGGLGLAAIIAAGKAPAAVVRSMCAARGMSVFCGGKEKLPYDAEVKWLGATGTQWINTGVISSNGIIFSGKTMRFNGNSVLGWSIML